MLKNKAAAILIAGMMLFTASAVMAQSVQHGTTVADTLPSTVVSATEFSINPDWMQAPTLYCMNIDRGSPHITRKRLALDPGIQELRWVAAHGPRREMLEAFLSRQAGGDDVVEEGPMARVGGAVDSWSEIKSSQRQIGHPLVSIGHLDVSLIGPERVDR